MYRRWGGRGLRTFVRTQYEGVERHVLDFQNAAAGQGALQRLRLQAAGLLGTLSLLLFDIYLAQVAAIGEILVNFIKGGAVDQDGVRDAVEDWVGSIQVGERLAETRKGLSSGGV